MHWQIGRTLFWTTIALVSASFVLALVGEETTSSDLRTLILHWHEWIGLLSFPTLFAVVFARYFARHRWPSPLPRWLPGLRRSLEITLYLLLVAQPISGWLLASHEGKLASLFGWTLPPLASPSSRFAEYGYVYHGLGGVLILVIAAISLRINLVALVGSWVRSGRRAGPRAHRHREWGYAQDGGQ